MVAKRSSTSKKSSKRTKSKSKRPASPWRNILLAASLVPLIAGVVLVVLYGFDVILWESAQAQLVIASLFALLTFASSNALQANWIPAAGWALVLVADWLLWVSDSTGMQILSFALGAAGLILLAVEIYLRMRNRPAEKKR